MAAMDTTLAPGFLVAVPGLPDRNFARSVVFLMEHTEGGAMGLIINRALNVSVGRLINEIGAGRVEGLDEPVLFGGPVSPMRGWVIHEAGWAVHGSLTVAPGVAISSSHFALEAIAKGEGPGKYHVCLGYSGWGAGQLEQEIAIGSWIPLPFSAELAFDVPIEERWEKVLRDNGLDPAFVVAKTTLA